MQFRESRLILAHVENDSSQIHVSQQYTVDLRYLDLAYLELPLISKWNSGPCFNMAI